MYVLTADGMKAWPLAGAARNTMEFSKTMGIDLLGLNNSASYDKLYRSQPWIWTVVNKLSRGIGRLPLGPYTDETVPRPVPEHKLAQLIKRPWPRGTAFHLKEAITGSLALYGHSIVIKDRPGTGRAPQFLWPIPWRYVGVKQGDNEPISHYVVRVNGQERRFLPEDVIHFMWWSPEGGLGCSPLEPLRITLALEDAAQRYQLTSFANGARPSGGVTTDKAMNKKDRNELRTELEATHGGVDNNFRIALLTHGLKWQPFSHSAAEAEVINTRKLTREEVCAAFDIQPPMVQILDRATFSNIDEQHRMLYQDTYAPWLSNEEETFGSQLIESERDFAGTILKYDLDGVLRGDPEKRTQQQQRQFQSASRTPNELRRDDGLDPVLGSMLPSGEPDPEHPANQVYIPANMYPIDKANLLVPNPEPSEAPKQISRDELNRFEQMLSLVQNGNGH